MFDALDKECVLLSQSITISLALSIHLLSWYPVCLHTVAMTSFRHRRRHRATHSDCSGGPSTSQAKLDRSTPSQKVNRSAQPASPRSVTKPDCLSLNRTENRGEDNVFPSIIFEKRISSDTEAGDSDDSMWTLKRANPVFGSSDSEDDTAKAQDRPRKRSCVKLLDWEDAFSIRNQQGYSF